MRSEFPCFAGCCKVCSTRSTVVPSRFPCFAGVALVVQWSLLDDYDLQGV